MSEASITWIERIKYVNYYFKVLTWTGTLKYTFEACTVYRAFLDLPTFILRPCDVRVAIVLSKLADFM